MGIIQTEEPLVDFHFDRHRLRAYVISSGFSFSFYPFLNLSGFYKIMSSKAAELYLYLWIHQYAVTLEKNMCKRMETTSKQVSDSHI